MRTFTRTSTVVLPLMLLVGCAADQYYAAGVSIEAAHPSAALEYYRLCLQEDPEHEEARARIRTRDFYAGPLAAAEAHVARGDFARALQCYTRVAELAALLQPLGGPRPDVEPDLDSRFEEVARRAATQRFQEGEAARERGDAKASATAYRECMAFDPGYPQARERYQEQLEAATRRIAILRFGSPDAAYRALAAALTDQVLTKAIQRQPEFLQFVTRSHLDQLLDEHELAETSLVEPSSAPELGKLLGLHVIVVGDLTAVNESDTGWVAEPGHDTAEVTVVDGAGNKQKKQLSATWEVVSRSTRASVTASYQVIDVSTARIVATDRLTKECVASSKYARKTSGDVEAIPGAVRALLESPRTEPTPPRELAQAAIDQLGEQLATTLVRQFR